MIETHAKLAPSAAKRWMTCPGSVRLSEKVEDKTSVHAAEGSLAHHLGEWALKNNTDAGFRSDDSSTLGLKIPLISETLKVDQEMIDYVQIYLDTVRADMAETGGVLTVEKKGDLHWVHKDISGTSDASVGQLMGLLRVYDLKYGKGVVVEPEENPQQMIYALIEILEVNPNMYEEVELVIVQPRAFHPAGPVRRWRISVSDLFKWAKQKLKPAALATMTENALLVSGDHCRFCNAKPICPELIDAAAKSAMVEFGAVSIDTAPEALNGEEIAKVLQFTTIMSAWVESVKEYALGLMNSGTAVPGYKLVAKKANRYWVDKNEVENKLALTFGDAIYDIVEPKLKSVAKMEKVKGIDKRALTQFWSKPDAGNTIVPISDKRKEVAAAAASDFGEVINPLV